VIIKIFKAGVYPQGRWDRERLERLVDAYDPEGGIEAPCVVGHYSYGTAIENELAFGWVRSLRLDDQEEVWADIEASEQLKEWVATRKLGYVSAAIMADDREDERKPPRLAHVAFLGRTNPQIATTRLPALYEISNNKDGNLTFCCQEIRIKKEFKNTPSGDGGGSEKPEGESKEIVMSNEQEGSVDELKRQNQELEARLAEAEKKNEEYEAKEAKAEVSRKLDELIEAGKVAPSSRDEFANVALSLAPEGQKVFFDALGKAAPQVAEEQFAKDGTAPAAMSNDEIRAFAAERHLSFETAVEMLQREGRLEV